MAIKVLIQPTVDTVVNIQSEKKGTFWKNKIKCLEKNLCQEKTTKIHSPLAFLGINSSLLFCQAPLYLGNQNFGNWTFGNWTFSNWTFGNGTFGNWTFGNWNFSNWTFGNKYFSNSTFDNEYFGNQCESAIMHNQCCIILLYLTSNSKSIQCH